MSTIALYMSPLLRQCKLQVTKLSPPDSTTSDDVITIITPLSGSLHYVIGAIVCRFGKTVTRMCVWLIREQVTCDNKQSEEI